LLILYFFHRFIVIFFVYSDIILNFAGRNQNVLK